MDNLVISLATNPATAMTKDGKVLGISRGTNTHVWTFQLLGMWSKP